MLTVVCCLWHDAQRARSYTFNHDHVRILRNMVARNLSIPHRFVCVTDDAIEGIETVPIDWTKHFPGTCGVKLMLWRPDIGTLLGERIFYLDLDVVITGSLDPLVNRTDDIVLWRNPNYTLGGRRAFYQGSVQLLAAGARPQVWELAKWPEALPIVNRRFGGFEQAWLSEVLPWDEAHWTSADGLYGAGRLGDAYPGVQTELPLNARIVSFPGNREPSQAEVQQKHGWIRDHYH